MPPDMRQWLAEDHPVWVVLDAVEQFELAEFRAVYRADGHGGAAFDPAVMIALLLYAYSCGERSSRRIERLCVENVAFRVICGGLAPDHATIARFRVRHEQAIKGVFGQVLRLLAEVGMVRLNRVALDGTKIAANASWSANKTLPQIEAMLAEAAAVDAAESAEHGSARGDQTPPQLARRGERIARLSRARGLLADAAADRAAEQRAKLAAWQARRDAGVRWPGRRPLPPDSPMTSKNGRVPRANVTDPEARTVKTRHTLMVGYNAQAVVTDDQVIVGVMLTQQAVDGGLLHPVLDRCRDQLRAGGITPRLRTVLADAGYASEQTFQRAHRDKIRLLAPLAKDTRILREGGDPAAGRDLRGYPHTAAAQRRLRHWKGRADYRHRGRTVEPVFGQLKTCQQMTRFSRRGLTACDSEWHLAAAAHNLRKLHRHRTH